MHSNNAPPDISTEYSTLEVDHQDGPGLEVDHGHHSTLEVRVEPTLEAKPADEAEATKGSSPQELDAEPDGSPPPSPWWKRRWIPIAAVAALAVGGIVGGAVGGIMEQRQKNAASQ